MGIDQQPYDIEVSQESTNQLKQRHNRPAKEQLQVDNMQGENDDQMSFLKSKCLLESRAYPVELNSN